MSTTVKDIIPQRDSDVRPDLRDSATEREELGSWRTVGWGFQRMPVSPTSAGLTVGEYLIVAQHLDELMFP